MTETMPDEGREGTITKEIDQIKAHVQAQLAGRVRELDIEIRQGGLVLRGLAWTYHAKQLAQHVAKAACRHPITANEIEVS